MGELMSVGSKLCGLTGAVVNRTVRDIARVPALGYPLLATGTSPVSVTGKKEPKESQVPIRVGGTIIRPGDVIFADSDGVVAIPKEHLAAVVEAADALGRNEASCRDRLLSGEKLQSVSPAA